MVSRTFIVFVFSSLLLPACGDGEFKDKDKTDDPVVEVVQTNKEAGEAEEQQPSAQLTRSYVVDEFYMSHIQIDHPGEDAGAREREEHTFYEHHPIGIHFGITAQGKAMETNIMFGLMEKLSTDTPTDADYAALKHCSLGSVVVAHSGGDEANEVHYNAEFIVPKECADGLTEGTSRTYNLWISADTEDEVKEEGEDEEDHGTVLVFATTELGNDRNKKCLDQEGEAGCIFDIVVKPTHGINLKVLELTPDSSVAVISSSTSDHSDSVSSSGSSNDEHNSEFMHVNTEYVVYGAEGMDEDSSDALSGKTATLSYSICPGADARPGDTAGTYVTTCADGSTWAPLTIYSTDRVNQPDGHSSSESITNIIAGQPNIHSHKLYAEGTTRTKLVSGGEWANYVYFSVRACLESSDITEKSTTSEESYDTTLSDNCKVTQVTLTRPVATDHSANNYSFNRSWSKTYGSTKTVGANVSFSTNNTLNLSGAVSRTSGDLKTVGWLNASIIHSHAYAGAYVALVGSYIDIQQKIVGLTLFSYQKSVQEVSYTKSWSLSKEVCATFRYGVLVLSLNVSICASGSGGFDSGLAISAKTGSNTTFSSATKIGDITVTFTPNTNFGVVADAYVSVTVAKGGISGTLTLVKIELPLVSTLNWGLTSLSPVVLTFRGNVSMQLDITTLNGNLTAYADLRSVKWCSRSFKIWGHRHHISYPCGFSWSRKANFRIVSWQGKTYSYKLLDRYKTLSLQ